MYTIKKNYRDETKEILNIFNENFYNFSTVTIDCKEFKITLNDNNKTEIFIKHFISIEEIIHANFGGIKVFKYIFN